MEAVPPSPTGEGVATGLPQNALLDFFFPGFSVFSGAVSKYLHIDLNLYIPLVLLFGGLTFAWRYFSEFFTSLVETHLMSVVDIRADDEIYNYVLAWVANQRFSKTARRFVVNTNLNSRSWYLWRWDDEDEQEEDGEVEDGSSVRRQKKKVLAYTPNFGSHWFLYKGRILVFRRSQNQQQSGWLTKSEREEISISCFGRNPWVLKELLHEAREEYMKRDEAKTLIYRGTTKSGSSEPQWQRCLARTSRPLSTVILNSDVKQKLIDDANDYLNPSTRRWYANRGIPYRRGYLLYGPPGTGKSSLSLALAGFFKMRIYIVSLNSVTANEENLASLFAELPRRCVVLLEDIDTAGLTHTREGDAQSSDGANSDNAANDAAAQSAAARSGPQPATPNQPVPAGRLSLSGLLNLLDGVCSQEGRLLVMTTNHLEKLDKALIRPGRVDMIVKFDLADAEMTAAIFRAIYAPLEGDDVPSSSASKTASASTSRALFQLESTLKAATAITTTPLVNAEEDKKRQAAEAEAARKKAETIAQVDTQAARFAARIPAHEFSPAELQGYLLKNKRDPEGAVEGAEQWVVSTRKEKKEKELKEAQEKREKEEKEKKEKEEKEKKEKEEKAKKEKKEAKKKAGSKTKKASAAKKKAGKKSSSKSDSEAESGSSSSSSASSSSDEADSASESEKEKEEKTTKKTLKKKRSSTKPAANGDAPAPAAAAAAAAAAVVAEAPAQLKETEEKKEEELSSASSEPKTAEPPVVIPPLITVDTDLTLKGTGLEAQRTPAADSGYGTP